MWEKASRRVLKKKVSMPLHKLNHNEILTYTVQNSCYQESQRYQMLKWMWGKKRICTQLEVQHTENHALGFMIMENTMEAS